VTRVPDHAADPITSTSVWNPANALTIVRLLAVPVLAWLLFQDSEVSRNVAALVFVAASITDFLDGAIARKYMWITNFGKIADPIADKLLTGVALIGLSALSLLPWWITIVIIVREVVVTLLRFWVIEHGVISASRGGKAKTLAQTIAITMYLVELPQAWAISDVWGVAQGVAMGVALILTLATAIQYISQARQLRRRIQKDAR
jgi:CDP-diacylglycerol---glycerol-3-phosphate 3-phosphatidyltransferase